MKIRLSKRQREVLVDIAAACVPHSINYGDEEHIVPLYIEYLRPFMFNTERELNQFLTNLESRGLIEIRQQAFLYITDKGKEAIS